MEAPGSSGSALRGGTNPGGSTAEADGRIIASRYRLLRCLGTGGMGSVYLCEHLALGRRYALKLLPRAQGFDDELVTRFRQEAQAASRIAQENVVDVVDFGEDQGGDLYYVMEHLEGRTLTQLVREEAPLQLPRALTLLEQVCRALAAAHAAGVVHRDVKPDNVLVERLADGTERAKLIDFGISHLVDTGRLTRVGEIIGTPEYMAPEQASGHLVDELTDVYATGVLAFELLTGTLPLLGPTAIATLVAHQTLPPPAPSARRRGLPPEVDALVLRALSKEKSRRFPTMQAFAAEVMRLRVSASLASVSGRMAGAWSDTGAGTGRGGTIALAAAPLPEASRLGPAPILPALEPAAGGVAPHAAPPRRRRGGWALLAGALALGLAAAVAASLAGDGAAPTTALAPAPPPAPAPAAGTAPTPSPPPSPPPVAAPAVAPPPAAPPPARTAPRPSPARREAPLHDPYATPGETLKPDPFR